MSRDEAIKKMKAVKAYMTAGNPMWGITEMAEAFDAAIEALEREPKKGKWIDVEDEDEWQCFKCSECGHYAWDYTGEIMSNEWKFCPWCGAMTEGEDDEHTD